MTYDYLDYYDDYPDYYYDCADYYYDHLDYYYDCTTTTVLVLFLLELESKLNSRTARWTPYTRPCYIVGIRRRLK
jgi:hypothetical protein